MRMTDPQMKKSKIILLAGKNRTFLNWRQDFSVRITSDITVIAVFLLLEV